MKRLLTLPVALLGVLVATSGCGGSDAGITSSPDASLESGTPVTTTDGGADGTLGNTNPEAGSSGDDDGSSATSDGGGGCGDGVVSGTEECDDGATNGSTGSRCTNSCTWTCVAGDALRGDHACDDGNPCNGSETCKSDHSCATGAPPADGTTCGTAKVCNGGACADAVCGDGFVTSPEECDDGSNNGGSSDGCTKGCTFVCVSTDGARNCTPVDACQGKGTCNDATHTCTPGAAEDAGTVCTIATSDGGAGDAGVDICSGGACVPGTCGDGVVEAPEKCDFGAGNGAGTGCELDCTFSCTKAPNETCVTTDLCAGTNTCTTVSVSGHSGQKCVVGTPPIDGTTCPGGTCQNHVCTTTTCGNGVVDGTPLEECDFGTANNLAGSGCEPDCKFSCHVGGADDCANRDLCLASPMTCQPFTGPNSDVGKKCQTATPLATCADCGGTSTGICVGHKCGTSVCNDGCIDARLGETCDPPNGTTCDSFCHTIVAAVCGNTTREAGEQCDDGNKVNLDGCDSSCQFEEVQRATSVSIEKTTDTFCPANALGNVALTSTAVDQVNPTLLAAVKAGTTNIAFKFMGLTDLTGQSQASGLGLGALSGVPAAAPSGKTYDGTNDSDWWYTTAATTIDSSRNPLSIIGAKLAATVLSTPTPGTLNVTISIAGALATLHMSSANIQAHVGGLTPVAISSGTTPGHLASEHDLPSLTTTGTFGTMNSGLLCGNISAASLASVPMPALLLSGTTACVSGFPSAPVYTASNSLLDAIVGGCSATLLAIPVINSTQPDEFDGSVPAAGQGFKYTLVMTGNKVTSCKDKSGATVDFQTCLKAAAYSSYFGFGSDRVIFK